MKTKLTRILPTLILAGAFAFALTPSAEARSPRARELCGIIQSIDPQSGMLTIQTPEGNAPAAFAIKRDTRFIKDWKFADAGALQEGLRACVYYRSPFFGKPFVTKVVWTKQN